MHVVGWKYFPGGEILNRFSINQNVFCMYGNLSTPWFTYVKMYVKDILYQSCLEAENKAIDNLN